MRRQRFRKQAVGVSLFPFLAVMICTMGALIVLLVLVVQQASVRAETITRSQQQQALQSQPDREDLLLQQQDEQWRLEVLQQQRKQQIDKLAAHRLELSHLEDHLRRLEEKWNRLRQQHDLLQPQDAALDRAAALAQLERLKQQIATAKQRLQEAQQQAAGKGRSFAIIPYQGPHGTQRRPIYIECRGGRVVLQPEGVVLTAEDFRGPPVPGNPLDAALLAVREYLARYGGLSQNGEPYPLLIVRPDGAYSYAAARDAMRSWDDEFGYELVGQDMQIEYPPADPRLAEVLRKTIEDARRRQSILAAVAPKYFGDGGSGHGGLRVAPGQGGFITESENPELGPPEDENVLGPLGPSGQQRTGGADAPATGPPPQRSASQGGTLRPGEAAISTTGGPGASADLSQQRGRNWALPNANRSATGFTRPIRVDCFADRLAIVPQSSTDEVRREVRLTGPLRGDIDEFVSALWKHLEGWGIAGAGAYWKPVLRVEVAPGGQHRFEELQRLLRGSGIKVERRSP